VPDDSTRKVRPVHAEPPQSAQPGEGIAALVVPEWGSIPGLRHGFLGRRGGASTQHWASLNLSYRVGDRAEVVDSNWHRVRASAPGLAFVAMRQVHGDRIVPVQSVEDVVGEADGVITDRSSIGLCVLTADCVPILMVAAAAHVILAVHAGWRGTLAGIAAAAVRSAREEFELDPVQLSVALGPSIGGCCYEVDAQIGARLEAGWGAMPEAWKPSGGKGMLDLRAANRHILNAAGVPSSNIIDVGPCTACAQESFFSHRRSGGRAGRQLSFIGWT
jgi:purine-nucleoside/S-methyl-5'-thioadenosine phosphorylase / adenosine deaminase